MLTFLATQWIQLVLSKMGIVLENIFACFLGRHNEIKEAKWDRSQGLKVKIWFKCLFF